MNKYIITLSCVLLGFSLKAQTEINIAETPEDGFANISFASDSKPFDYPTVNPVNIRFFKRIWRDINLKEEKNRIYATPGNTLIDLLLDGVRSGNLTAYDPSNDSFKIRLTARQALARLVDSVMVPIFDKDGNQIDSKLQANDFNSEKVVAFRIKEDVFFDKVRSKVETRIVGIAPVMNIESGGQKVGEAPVFWLYFPQCRAVLTTREVTDADSGIEDLTFDDLFLQRQFAGKILKESNPSDQRIVDYVKDPQEQEKEAKRIESTIEEYKTKMWGFTRKF